MSQPGLTAFLASSLTDYAELAIRDPLMIEFASAAESVSQIEAWKLWFDGVDKLCLKSPLSFSPGFSRVSGKELIE